MPSEMAWIPDPSDLVTIGEVKFLSVGFNHSTLGLLCGTQQRLRCNSFLDAMAASRNRACEEAVDKVVTEVFGHTENYAKTKLNMLRLRVVQEHSSKLPGTVEVKVPNEAAHVTAVFETDKRRRVAVKCDTETLNIMVEGVVTAAKISDRKKPRSQDDVRFLYPEVKMHRQRDTPYVRFLDADGQWRFRFGKSPAESSRPRDIHLHEEAMVLHEFFIHNHHVPIGAADEGQSEIGND